MTIEYAQAHSRERIAHAERKRLQREATLENRAAGGSSARPVRTAVGNQLIKMGERLSARRSPMPSTAKGHS